jgi:hypothetical protein
LGYFNKILLSDRFVILDQVQFQKTGGGWSNRVQLVIGGKADWATMPIIRSYHGVLPYDQVEINDATGWREKFLRTMQMNYARTPYFQLTMSFLQPLVEYPTRYLADFNLNAIKAIMLALDLPLSKLTMQSKLDVTGSATDLLVSIVKGVNGSSYLCGGGTAGYQEDEKFSRAGIKLIYQNFQHPLYSQKGISSFIPGLSIIDGLMNCGFDGVKLLIQGGVQKAKEKNDEQKNGQ